MKYFDKLRNSMTVMLLMVMFSPEMWRLPPITLKK